MTDTPTDRVAAALDEVRSLITERDELARHIGADPASVRKFDAVQDKLAARATCLLAALDQVLWQHKIEPLYMNSDDGECGCPVPTEYSSSADEAIYEDAHPEGYGPDGTGLVCSKRVVGHWCRGCADIAVEHCFEAPKDYPPEKCSVRHAISAALFGEEAGRG